MVGWHAENVKLNMSKTTYMTVGFTKKSMPPGPLTVEAVNAEDVEMVELLK